MPVTYVIPETFAQSVFSALLLKLLNVSSHQSQRLRVIEFLSEKFYVKKAIAAIFSNIAKAFDKDWQENLIHKLIRFNFPSVLICLNCFKAKNFKIRFDNICKGNIIQTVIIKNSGVNRT